VLHFIYACDLANYPQLQTTMFQDRARQFKDRLKWDVSVDDQGWERDQYDDLNPLYVILSDGGRHAASMRLLPTTGPTMVNDHFDNLLPDGRLHSAQIWECTRFCLAPGQGTAAASALQLGGGHIMQRFGVDHLVGVFDKLMTRIYRGIGASPDVMGTDNGICAGLWSFDDASFADLSRRAGIALDQVDTWFADSLATMGQGNANRP